MSYPKKPRIYIRDQNDEIVNVLRPKDYYDTNLGSYMKGNARTLKFTMIKGPRTFEDLTVINNLTFKYDEESYWLSCMIVEQTETTLTVTAWPLGLEWANEEIGPYTASAAMTFEQYFNILSYQKSIVLGLNEVSDKKITYEWTGTQTKLERLYSLATVFDAEIEFKTELNIDGSLNRQVLNVYMEHDDTHQGMGLDRRNEVFRYGKDVKSISYTVDKTEVKTAIIGTGKDGLTIASIEAEVKDADGNILYATYKTAKTGFEDPKKIYAVQAVQQFPSQTNTTDKWTVADTGESEYTTAQALYGYLLSELKKVAVPEVTWEVEGWVDGNVGDTIRIRDDGYQPPLLLEARISEQERDLDDPSQNKTTFTNVEILKSQLSKNIMDQVTALIAANKQYQASIETSNGFAFKNGEGFSTLYAVVRDGTLVVTDQFKILWYKDGEYVATAKTLTILASDIDGKALYYYEYYDGTNTLKGRAEVTATNVNDGPAGADGKTGADGKEGRGIKDTIVEYQAGTSGANPPTGTWVATAPIVSAGQYLWTRTTFVYTDNTKTYTYIAGRMGSNGSSGEAGVGVSSTDVAYQAGTSGTTPPTGAWSTSIPSVADNQYLWTRTTTNYTDLSKSVGYSVGKMGADGADAKLLYLSASSNVMMFGPTDVVKSGQSITITAKVQNASGLTVWKAIPYIGNAAQNEITLSGSGLTRTLDTSKWSNPLWTSVAITVTLGELIDVISVLKVKDGTTGPKGDDGGQGIQGPPGVDGKPTYTHWAYAMDALGKNNFSVDGGDFIKWSTLTQGRFTFESGITFNSLSGGVMTATTTSAGSRFYIGNVMPIGVPITMTMDVKANKDAQIRFGPWNGVSPIFPVTTEWTTITSVITAPAGASTSFYLMTSGVQYQIRDVSGVVNYTYAGSYVDQIATDSTDPTKYTWKRLMGATVVPHEGWSWSYDGTERFTTKYPNINWMTGGAATDTAITRTVSAWGYSITSDKVPVTAGKTYTGSIYYDSVSARPTSVRFYWLNSSGSTITESLTGNYIQPGDSGFAQVTATAPSGAVHAYLGIRHPTTETTSNTVKYRYGKVEEGSERTIWTTSPSVDFANAYPTFIGRYADTNEVGSEKPADYTWQRILGESGQNGADGKDAQEVFSGYLTNDAIVVPANSAGTVTDFSKATGTFITMLGQEKLTSGVTYSLASQISMTVSINSAGAYTVSALSADMGSAIFKAVRNGVEVQKQVIVVKSKQGPNGATGADGKDGATGATGKTGADGAKGDPTGIISQNTVPTAAQRYVGMLWKNTGASGYINGATYRWNGSAFELFIFTAVNISADNLAAISANLGTITAGNINGVTITGSKFVNNFTYKDGSVTYTGSTTIEDGNVIISRTGSNGATWVTKLDRTSGFEDTYRAGSSAPARTTQLGEGKLYMAESGVGGYLPASALYETSWTNLTLVSGWKVSENNPPQYRIFNQLDGSKLVRFRGQFTNTADNMAAGSHRPFGVNSLPTQILPNRTEFSWGLTNTPSGGRLSVTTTGDLQFQVGFACTYAAISQLSYIIE